MYMHFLNKLVRFPQMVFFWIFTDSNEDKSMEIQFESENLRLLTRMTLHNDNTVSFFDYNNKIVRNVLYYIKNRKHRKALDTVCDIISDNLLDILSEKELFENFCDPVLIPIPSSKRHLLKRGYNPSELIAESISKRTQIPCLKDTLYKSKSTPDQKTLRRYERLRNVKHSMSTNPKCRHQIKDRNIIIIDDIMTTGATLREAKRELLKSGAKKVMGVVVAH